MKKWIPSIKKYSVLVGLLALAAIQPVYSQEWPQKRPITLLLGFSPGGTADITARLVADKLGKIFNQTFLVENRPGANGEVAADAVKRAKPDGYTFLVAPDAVVTTPAVRQTKYDPAKDFAPVAMLDKGPLVLVVNPATKADNVGQLISLIKNSPVAFSYGTSGIGNGQHFAGEKFRAMTGANMMVIPYKGGGQAIVDLLSNQIPMAFLGTGPVIPYAKAGKLRILAVTTSTRFEGLPNVPTLDESGLKGFDLSQWIALVAPKGTSPEIINKMNSAVNKVLADPAVKERLLKFGMAPLAYTPAQLGDEITHDAATFKKLAVELKMVGAH